MWLTQQQLTKLYQCSKSNISEYIKHIFEEGELVKDSVVRKFRTTADEVSIPLSEVHAIRYRSPHNPLKKSIFFKS